MIKNTFQIEVVLLHDEMSEMKMQSEFAKKVFEKVLKYVIVEAEQTKQCL